MEIEASDYAGLVSEQEKKQQAVVDGAEKDPFTTVGFEHEFCGHAGPLEGISHVTVGRTDKNMPYVPLPFQVETDAADTLELVSPPFLLQTVNDKTPVPKPDQVQKVIKLAHAALTDVTNGVEWLADLMAVLGKRVGWTFQQLSDVTVDEEHISLRSKRPPGVLRDADSKIKVTPLEKHGGKIATQVNMATNAAVFRDLIASGQGPERKRLERVSFLKIEEAILKAILARRKEATPEQFIGSCERVILTNVVGQLGAFMQGVLRRYQHNRWAKPKVDFESLRGLAAELNYLNDAGFDIFLGSVGRKKRLTMQGIVQALSEARGEKRDTATPIPGKLRKELQYVLELNVHSSSTFPSAALFASHVKDVHGVWPKDSWDNIINAMLTDHVVRWPDMKPGRVSKILHERMLPLLHFRVVHAIRPAVEQLNLVSLLEGSKWNVELLAADVHAWMLHSVDTIAKILLADFMAVIGSKAEFALEGLAEPLMLSTLAGARRFADPNPAPQAGLYAHDRNRISPRQDTQINPASVQRPAEAFPDFGYLFVVESRSEVDGFVKQLSEIANATD